MVNKNRKNRKNVSSNPNILPPDTVQPAPIIQHTIEQQFIWIPTKVYNDLKTEKDRLSGENIQLLTSLNDKRDLYDYREKEIEKLKNINASLNIEIDTLKLEIAELSEQNKSLKLLIEELKIKRIADEQKSEISKYNTDKSHVMDSVYKIIADFCDKRNKPNINIITETDNNVATETKPLPIKQVNIKWALSKLKHERNLNCHFIMLTDTDEYKAYKCAISKRVLVETRKQFEEIEDEFNDHLRDEYIKMYMEHPTVKMPPFDTQSVNIFDHIINEYNQFTENNYILTETTKLRVNRFTSPLFSV